VLPGVRRGARVRQAMGWEDPDRSVPKEVMRDTAALEGCSLRRGYWN
jgi:hypothetical protein